MMHRGPRTLPLIAGVCLAFFCSLSFAAPDTVQEFFGYKDATSASLSPNGDQVATISRRDGKQRLSVIDVVTGESQVLLDLAEHAEDTAIASRIAWIDDSQLAVQYVEVRQGIARLIDTRRISFLLIAQLPDSATPEVRLKRVRTKGQLVNALPDEEDVFLYARSGATSHIYKIDTQKLAETNARLGKLDKVDGGQFIAANRVATVKGYAARWFLDGSGEPFAALTVNTGPTIKLSEIGADDEFTVIEEWSYGDDDPEPQERLFPIFRAADSKSYYCVRLAEGKRNAVFLVDFTTDEKTLIYENDIFEIRGPILSDTRDDMIGVQVVRDGGLQNVYFGDSDLGGAENGVSAAIDVSISRDLSTTKELRYREAHAQPGHYVLRDTQSGEEVLVGSAYPQLLNNLDSQQLDGRVSVEGLEIPYLLTIPGGASRPPHPLVVMPHGGPIGVFDDRYFDRRTQFLAARGYAVLRVNHRGSSGYSAALREAGKKQWGKLILDDIHAAAVEVSARSDIDKSRICAFGTSYGGYAALMLAIKYPDTYQCASSFAGVTDINLYIDSPYASIAQRAWKKENIGDTATEYDELKSQSPVYAVDRLVRPVQVFHGAEDSTVDVEHAHRMHLALNKYGKTVDFNIYEEVGHGFSDIEQLQDFYTRVANFLQEHIGPTGSQLAGTGSTSNKGLVSAQ